MGLGNDINLTENIKYNKGVVEHKFKEFLNNFIEIKNGDYLSWILYEFIEDDNNIQIRRCTIIGKVNDEPINIYEYNSNTGHILSVKAINKNIQYINLKTYFCKINDINQFEKFQKMDSFDCCINNEKKFYLSINYCSENNIYESENENEVVINLRDLNDKEKVLHEMKAMTKEDILFVQIISKKDEIKVKRIIGKIKDIYLEKEKNSVRCNIKGRK